MRQDGGDEATRRRLARKRERRRQVDEDFKDYGERWLAREHKKDSSEYAAFGDLDAMLRSDVDFPEPFSCWIPRTLAEPYRRRPRKHRRGRPARDNKGGIQRGHGPRQFRPVVRRTQPPSPSQEGRHGPNKIVHTFIAGELKIEKELKDFREKQYATSEDILDFAHDGLLGKARHRRWKEPRELIQHAAFPVVLLLTGARPADLLPGNGYDLPSDSLQYKDLKFSLFWHNGEWCLRCRIAVRNQKGHRGEPLAHKHERGPPEGFEPAITLL